MGEVIQLQGDQRKDVQEFLVDKKEGLELDAKTIKVCPSPSFVLVAMMLTFPGPWVLKSRAVSFRSFSTDRPLEDTMDLFHLVGYLRYHPHS
jgi:hypothetical protein